MPGYAHAKSYYQFVENFCVYLPAKIQFYTLCLSVDTAKICKLILCILWMPDYIQPQ